MKFKTIGVALLSLFMFFSILPCIEIKADETYETVRDHYSLKTSQDFSALQKGTIKVNMQLEINPIYSENIAAYQLALQLTNENGHVIAGLEEDDLAMEFDSILDEQDIKEFHYDKTTGIVQLYVASTKNLVAIMEDTHILNLGTLTIDTKVKEGLKITVANDDGNFKAVLQDRNVVPQLKENETLTIVSDGSIILTQMPANIDLSILEKAVENAEKTIQEKQYTSDNTTAKSWETYVQAYENANTVLKHFETTMTQDYIIMIANELNLAVSNLTTRIAQSVYEQLVQTIAKAEEQLNVATSQQQMELQEKIDEANEILQQGYENTPSSLTKTFQQMIAQLNELISVISNDLELQKSILAEHIAILEHIQEQKDLYQEESIKDIDTLLVQAKEVLNNPNSQINELRDMIVKTKDAIEKAIFKVQKEQLKALIEQANNLNKKDYTEESYANLQTVLSDAVAVYENEQATQQEVDAAVQALQQAIQSLDIVKVTSTDTGDTTQKALLMGLCGLSIVLMASIVFVMKKRNEPVLK